MEAAQTRELRWRRPVTSSARSRLYWLLALTAGTGLVLFTQWPLWKWNPFVAVIPGMVGVAFLATAAVLSEEPGQRSNARLFGLTGLAWMLAWLDTRDVAALPLIAWLCAPLSFVLGAALLLRYPEARLSRRRDRSFVHLALVWLLATRFAMVFTSSPESWGYGSGVWWPTLVHSRRIGELVAWIGFGGAGCLAVVFVLLMVARVRHLRGVDRRSLPVVAVAGAAAGVAASSHVIAALPSLRMLWLEQAIVVEGVAMLAVPAAFLVAALRERLARGAIADLVLRVAEPGTAETVREALRRALSDPALDIFYWVPGVNDYVADSGKSGEWSHAAEGRLVRRVDASDGRPLAVVLIDPSLDRHAGLVEAALTACALAMENARLHTTLRAQLAEVRASRKRILEAGLTERYKLERDLHDGAQQRLLALSMSMAAIQRRLTDPATLAMLDQARAELRQALHEMRDLARGIHPAVLLQAGLGAAVEAVVEGLPLPVLVDVPQLRWDAAVEATAYFVVCEALANTVKHGGASRASVCVQPVAGQLTLEIVDDGRGGAISGQGGGLAGLRDRLSALGGDLDIVSPPGAGTHIVARIPCG